MHLNLSQTMKPRHGKKVVLCQGSGFLAAEAAGTLQRLVETAPFPVLHVLL